MPARPYQGRTVYYAGAWWRVSTHLPGLVTVTAAQGTYASTPGVRCDVWPAA